MTCPPWEGLGRFTYYFAQGICIAGLLVALWALVKTLIAPGFPKPPKI